MDKYFEELCRSLTESGAPYDMELIEKAYEFAKKAHSGQKRVGGQEYIVHPVAVAQILIEMQMDTESICAALLHDVLEDTEHTYEELEAIFGGEIVSIVDGLTKLEKIPYSSKEEQQLENLRKMLLAMAKDIRVIIIKLADRLHNLRTLECMPPDSQRFKALETMEIFAPLAHRLGIEKVELELKDIALQYLDPFGYKEISDHLKENNAIYENIIAEIKETIEKRLSEYKIKTTVEGRVKHIYSIYNKMFGQNKTFDEIYDLYALRVICSTPLDCYNILGIIHDAFTPIPGRFKDYIGTPKPNGYQSLHTTVMGNRGVPFEVQIRTWEMHHNATYGIAAHWKYKLDPSAKTGDSMDDKLRWIRTFLESQQDLNEPEDFIRTFKIDLFSDEVFVFTPKGDVVNLPLGSNIIDFAYTIHSEVGNRMIGAKVDGRIVNFDYELSNGEIVEIMTSKTATGPKFNWLRMVKTSHAKNKIRQWFKKERFDDNLELGRDMLSKEIKSNEIFLPPELLSRSLVEFASRSNISTLEEFYAAVGYGSIQASKVVSKLKNEYKQYVKSLKSMDSLQLSKQVRSSSNGVIVEGIENCLVKFARCCNPVYGDEIDGYITKGFGISVHKTNCPNRISSIEKEPERWLRVRWAKRNSKSENYVAAITLLCTPTRTIISNVTSFLFSNHINMKTLNTKNTKEGKIQIFTEIYVRDVDQLESIITKLGMLKNVDSVSRSGAATQAPLDQPADGERHHIPDASMLP